MVWWQQFLAIVSGALISGIIGVLIVFLTDRIRNKEWVQENIIRRLYNELDCIRTSQAFEVDLSFKSFWNQLDSYSKLKVGKKLRNHIANYTDILSRFHITTQHYDKVRWQRNFEDCLRRTMTNYLSDDGNNIWFEKSPAGEQGYRGISITIKEFLAKYLPVLTSLRDEDSLVQALITESERHKWGHEKYFRAWQSQRPTVFAELSHDFRNLKMPQEYINANEELQKARQELVSTADSLANKLLEESKKRW